MPTPNHRRFAPFVSCDSLFRSPRWRGCCARPRPRSALTVGHRQVTFVDPARANRAVLTEVYYPADAAGDNVPVAAGEFPVVSFGHGYLMPWSAYSYLWSALVPEGYIVALPRTEGSLFPSHAEFGRDLAFVVPSLRAAGGDAGSPFFGHVAATAAVMGHSMGGGASVLAIAGAPGITAVANLAAAETNPSAIAAAAGVTAPALVFAGERDCVAPPATHQQPIYSAFASACKTYVSVTGGSHCQFADANSTCSLGEAGCAAAVSRAAQQATVLRYLLPWLAWVLKGDAAAWASFQSLRANDTAITSEQSCANVSPSGRGIAARAVALRCAPNPASGSTRIAFRLAEPGTARVEIFDLSGRRVRALVSATLQAGEHGVTWDGTRDDGRRASAGVYTVRVAACGRVESRTLAWLR